MDFHGGGPELLEIYWTMAGRVGNIIFHIFNSSLTITLSPANCIKICPKKLYYMKTCFFNNKLYIKTSTWEQCIWKIFPPKRKN